MELESDYEDLELRHKRVRERWDNSENIRLYYETIGFPEAPLKTIEETLRNADKFTIRAIQEYLKADNQELIKNLAQVMNPSNQATLIAYKDGAIGRNEALIKRLESLKKDSFHDKLEGLSKPIQKIKEQES